MCDKGWRAFVVVSQALRCSDELPWEVEVALLSSSALLCRSDPGLLRRTLPTAAIPGALCSLPEPSPKMSSRSLAVVPGLLTCNPGSSLIPNCPFPCVGLDPSHLHNLEDFLFPNLLDCWNQGLRSCSAIPFTNLPVRCCSWAQGWKRVIPGLVA